MRPSPRIARAEVARTPSEQRPERLDDDLLLADEPIARERDASARGDDERRRALRAARRGPAEQRGEVAERDRLAAHLDRAPPSSERSLDAHDLLDARERQPEDLAAALDEQHVEECERERQQQRITVPCPARCAPRASAERLDVGLDRVESDAAAGDVRHLDRPSRSPAGRARRRASRSDRASCEQLRRHAASVVGRPRSRPVRRAARRAARRARAPACRRLTLVGRLDPVGDGVAQQVARSSRRCRRGSCGRAGSRRRSSSELDVLAVGGGKVAHGAREAAR